MTAPLNYITLSFVPRELITDGVISLWGLLAFLFEGCADEADQAITERYPEARADRVNVYATGAIRPFDDEERGTYRKGDGVVRMVWPIFPSAR